MSTDKSYSFAPLRNLKIAGPTGLHSGLVFCSGTLTMPHQELYMERQAQALMAGDASSTVGAQSTRTVPASVRACPHKARANATSDSVTPSIPDYEIGGLLSVVGPGFSVLAPSGGPLFCTADWLPFFSHNTVLLRP
jgi:hypothetical protein